MSLDVYLRLPGVQNLNKGSGIFIRENGQVKEMTRAEWDERFPDRDPLIFESDDSEDCYSANITHNLNRMASEAGIYDALWRPDGLGIIKAEQLIEPLTQGLKTLKDDPARFEKLNPSNGWGDYKGLVEFVEKYLSACRQNPEALVSVSR